jgi:hypothetical protein
MLRRGDAAEDRAPLPGREELLGVDRGRPRLPADLAVLVDGDVDPLAAEDDSGGSVAPNRSRALRAIRSRWRSSATGRSSRTSSVS